MSVPDWRQPRGLRGRPGFKPTCRAEFATWTASGQASVPVGGGRAWPGFETTRQANDQQPSAGGVEAAAGPAGHASVPVGGGRARADHPAALSSARCGGRHRACGAWPRCRWAAAGPGRASRSITPSRRLACGDLAGGPPPTGTHSGQTQQDRPRGARKTPWCHKPRPKVRTPRSTPGSGRLGGRRGDRAR